MNFDEIVQKIVEKTGKEREEILSLIEKRIDELSGLVTKEGAALLVAREFGLNLTKKRDLEIKDLDFGMRNFNIRGRVFRISRIVEFDRTNGGKGKVCSLFIGDSTGFVRVPLWDGQVEMVENGEIKVGDCLQLVNCIARENIFGDLEIVLGRYGKIIKIDEDPNIPSVEDLLRRFEIKPKFVNIKEIDRPGFYEINASIVHFFKSRYTFEICPFCNLSIENCECKEKPVKTKKALVIPVMLDDGTGTIRGVFFREIAEKLVGMSAEEFDSLSREERTILFTNLLGVEFILKGRVRKNKVFDCFEFVVNDFEYLNYSERSRKLAEELGL